VTVTPVHIAYVLHHGVEIFIVFVTCKQVIKLFVLSQIQLWLWQIVTIWPDGMKANSKIMRFIFTLSLYAANGLYLGGSCHVSTLQNAIVFITSLNI
jgi:hypothetical protein